MEGQNFLCKNSSITFVPAPLVRAQSHGHIHLQRGLGDGVSSWRVVSAAEAQGSFY